MDLNQLYFDHQALQMKARAATSSDLQQTHCRDAADIAGRIGSLQNLLGATAAPSWMAIAAPVPARAVHTEGRCNEVS